MGIDEDKFDRQKRIGNWEQDRLTAANVLVVGAGALGNEVVKMLCQLGVGKITLVDDDFVVKANLNRTLFFTQEDAKIKKMKAKAISDKAKILHPDTQITPIIMKVEDLDEGLFGGFDCAFSCLDNLNARLHLNAHSYGKMPFIDGGTTGFIGKVQVVSGNSSCFECSMSKKDYDLLWQKYSCVGEVLDFLDPKMPAITTTNSIVASIQANEFLKLRMDSLKGEKNLVGKYLQYDGRINRFEIYEIQKRKDCPVHMASLPQ